MAIPLSQLSTWSKQGSTAASSTTYQSIRNALLHEGSPIKHLISSGNIKIYLQGSYAHDTNIRGDSDVDVVVELTSTFNSNKLALPPPQLDLHNSAYQNASYNWSDLKRDVIIALRNYYGQEFVDASGKKSIKVLPNSGRLRADVIPVTTYRKYEHFFSDADHAKEEGVVLYHALTGREIVNYPKHHYDNAVAKQGATNNQYKNIVRILKNARTYLVDHGLLQKEKAPSYFIQGLVYNVPNPIFTTGNAAEISLATLRHLYEADVNQMVSQNEIHLLVGETEEQWKRSDALEAIIALVKLWDNWR